MLVVQTAGDPPNLGKIILATIGWTRKSRPELIKRVRVNRTRKELDSERILPYYSPERDHVLKRLTGQCCADLWF